MVWGHIPGTAVLASIPLLQILSKLPSYFLYHDISDAKESPLFKLGWDYARKKPSYRQFCQAMSDRFLRMPVEKRFRDTTVGSVRLALALLRPYIHKHVSEDFATSTTHVAELAYVIAQWPGRWWVREHPEIHDLVRCVVHMIGEEMREARRVQALADATRMQDIVGGLEQLAHAYEARSRPGQLLTDIHISPLTSPSRTLPPSPSASEPNRHKFRLGSTDIVTSDMTVSEGVQTDEEAKSVSEDAETEVAAPADDESAAAMAKVSTYIPSREPHSIMVGRTASCFLTGLLVGSFIALCILAPDRRQLARHLT